jgi:hypothetical protein
MATIFFISLLLFPLSVGQVENLLVGHGGWSQLQLQKKGVKKTLSYFAFNIL